jgi:predicted nucleic-acid-binding protein
MIAVDTNILVRYAVKDDRHQSDGAGDQLSRDAQVLCPENRAS